MKEESKIINIVIDDTIGYDPRIDMSVVNKEEHKKIFEENKKQILNKYKKS